MTARSKNRSTGTGTAERGALRARASNHASNHASNNQRGGESLSSGLHSIGPSKKAADALLYVPAGYKADTPAPLVLMLHGAGGDARNGLVPLQDAADSVGLILLAPGSREATWDVIVDDFGPDVDFIDGLLAETFDRCSVDPSRIAVEGFSDGASYALSLGISNGDLFTHIIAFSPGFLRPSRQEGRPRIFISHGVHDTVLPINQCSRRIVPQLQQAGYDVTYDEFDDGHTVPRTIAASAVAWFEG